MDGVTGRVVDAAPWGAAPAGVGLCVASPQPATGRTVLLVPGGQGAGRGEGDRFVLEFSLSVMSRGHVYRFISS